MIALLTRDAGNGGRRAAAPATTRAQAATTATTAPAATTTAPASTAPATRPIRPTPGNLLADGDFERDLAGWAPLGGAGVERVEGGASGRWAAAVTPGGPGAARPGMVRRDAATTEAGTTYEAVFWVKAPEGGQVVLALRELDGGREVSADQAGYALDSDRWQQLAVEHRTAVPGSQPGPRGRRLRPGWRRPPAGRRDRPPDRVSRSIRPIPPYDSVVLRMRLPG